MTANVSHARRRTIAWLLFASGFINYLDRAVVSVALPVIAVDLHLGPAAKGVLLSAFFWSYALMQLPMGWFADKFNLKWFYAAAFALWSLACGLTGFASTLAVLMAMRVLLGIGESIYVPGGMKAVSLLFHQRDRGLASGLMNCGTRAGLALGAPFIAWLVTSYGWKNSFFILGFFSLLWLIPWLAIYPAHIHAASIQSSEPLRARLRRLDRNLLGLCLGHVCFSYYWYLLVTWLPDYLVESRHLTLPQAGAFAVIPYLVFTVSEPLGGWAADILVRLGFNETRSRKTIISAAFLTSLMLLPAGRAANDTAAVWMIGAASLVGLATGNILALLQSVAPPAEVGLWAGIQNFAGNLSGIVAPIVTGILIERTGSYYPAFVLSVAVLLAGLPAYWFLVRQPPRPVRT
ncbi:MAG: MFS transporter [Acidobacteria bacterium]|nr:MFS transporter [Acidobacteriota bacterium]